MIVLGLESSCDETAAAVVRDGREVLSSVVSSQYDLHAEYAGVVPEIASRAHVERVLPVMREALERAGVGLGMIDAIAVGNRPGLIGCLLVGVGAAKALAWSLSRPIIGVDHVHAHLYSGMLERKNEDNLFPALGLVVSGGHTALFHLESWDQVTRLGGTIDDAVGEAYDKVATVLGLPHPGGPNLDRLARTAGADERAIDLPISRLSHDSLDFSFSGLKTSVLYAVKGVPNARDPDKLPKPLTNERKADIAASFQKAACDAVMLKLGRAADRRAYRSLLVGGGVSANSRLRAHLESFAAKRGIAALIPPMTYCMDNAAMIAGLGATLLARGRACNMNLQADPVTAL